MRLSHPNPKYGIGTYLWLLLCPLIAFFKFSPQGSFAFLKLISKQFNVNFRFLKLSKHSQTYKRVARTIQRGFLPEPFEWRLLTRRHDHPHILYWVTTNKDGLICSHNVTVKIGKYTLTHYYHLNSDLIQVSACPSNILESKRNQVFRPHLAFGYHVSLISFGLKHFLSLSLTYRTLTHSKITGKLFYRMSLHLGLSDISS